MRNLIITAGAIIFMLEVMSAQFGLDSLSRSKGRMDFATEEAACAMGIFLEKNPQGRREAENIGREVFLGNFGEAGAELEFIYEPETKAKAKWGKLYAEAYF